MPSPNPAFRRVWPQLSAADSNCRQLADRKLDLEKQLAAVTRQLQQQQLQRDQLEQQLQQIKPRVWCFDLPRDVKLAIVGQLGLARGQAARTCRQLWKAVKLAQSLCMFKYRVRCVTVGGYGEDYGHTVVCTTDGVFTCGSCLYGRLGRGFTGDPDCEDNPHDQHVPGLVSSLIGKEVVRASTGQSHVGVVTQDGLAYTWGYGQFGRLGHGSEENCLVPRVCQSLKDRAIIVGVACGDYHTLLWGREGLAYTCGLGGQGRLGHGAEQEETTPRVVTGLLNVKVTGGVTGADHTVVRTDQGQLYTFGDGGHGRLGNGSHQHQLVPCIVAHLDNEGVNVIRVAAGAASTAALSADGEVFTFGYGGDGRLGHGSEESEFIPRVVKIDPERPLPKVVSLSSGNAHTVVLTEAGQLWTFGQGGFGQLGHPTNELWCYKETRPRLVESLLDVTLVGTIAGGDHTAAWSDKSIVFTFGAGCQGRLGHGSKSGHEMLPRALPLQAFDPVSSFCNNLQP